MVGAVNAALPLAEYSLVIYRRISLRLIPLLAVCYGIAYVDRVNVGFAALQMNRDLHFSASIYGLGAGLFFVTYSVCEVPANLLLMTSSRLLSDIMIGHLAMNCIKSAYKPMKGPSQSRPRWRWRCPQS